MFHSKPIFLTLGWFCILQMPVDSSGPLSRGLDKLHTLFPFNLSSLLASELLRVVLHHPLQFTNTSLIFWCAERAPLHSGSQMIPKHSILPFQQQFWGKHLIADCTRTSDFGKAVAHRFSNQRQGLASSPTQLMTGQGETASSCFKGGSGWISGKKYSLEEWLNIKTVVESPTLAMT